MNKTNLLFAQNTVATTQTGKNANPSKNGMDMASRLIFPRVWVQVCSSRENNDSKYLTVLNIFHSFWGGWDAGGNCQGQLECKTNHAYGH